MPPRRSRPQSALKIIRRSFCVCKGCRCFRKLLTLEAPQTGYRFRLTPGNGSKRNLLLTTSICFHTCDAWPFDMSHNTPFSKLEGPLRILSKCLLCEAPGQSTRHTSLSCLSTGRSVHRKGPPLTIVFSQIGPQHFRV